MIWHMVTHLTLLMHTYDDGTIDAATDGADDLDLGDALDDFDFDDW